MAKGNRLAAIFVLSSPDIARMNVGWRKASIVHYSKRPVFDRATERAPYAKRGRLEQQTFEKEDLTPLLDDLHSVLQNSVDIFALRNVFP